jgi:hypothetical protein
MGRGRVAAGGAGCTDAECRACDDDDEKEEDEEGRAGVRRLEEESRTRITACIHGERKAARPRRNGMGTIPTFSPDVCGCVSVMFFKTIRAERMEAKTDPKRTPARIFQGSTQSRFRYVCQRAIQLVMVSLSKVA